MKHIFYKVGFAVLIIAAVMAITAGVAVAASPPESTILGAIQATVNNIWSTLTGTNGLAAIKSDLSTIKTDVGTVKTDVSTVKTDVVALDGKIEAVAANATRMRTYMFNTWPAPVGVVHDVEFDEDQIAHVSISFSGENFEGTDFIKISGYLGFSTVELVNLTGAAANGAHVVEFDANYFKISIYDASPGSNIKPGFVVTETYGVDSYSLLPPQD